MAAIVCRINFYCYAGGFQHVRYLTVLEHMSIPGFWEAFDDLPPELAMIPDSVPKVRIPDCVPTVKTPDSELAMIPGCAPKVRIPDCVPTVKIPDSKLAKIPGSAPKVRIPVSVPTVSEDVYQTQS